MISSTSLSAFSASLAQGGITATPGASPASPVTKVRAAGMQSTQPQASPTARLPQPDQGGTASPTRTLPRGSLLDLSV